MIGKNKKNIFLALILLIIIFVIFFLNSITGFVIAKNITVGDTIYVFDSSSKKILFEIQFVDDLWTHGHGTVGGLKNNETAEFFIDAGLMKARIGNTWCVPILKDWKLYHKFRIEQLQTKTLFYIDDILYCTINKTIGDAFPFLSDSSNLQLFVKTIEIF